MKKINEKQLFFTRIVRPRLVIMVKLCILFLICSMTTVTAVSAYSDPAGSVLTSGGTDENSTLQQDVVKGTIKDAVTGEALTGVTVMVKGTTIGTLTDINGQFSLRMPEKQASLVFSFIGYKSQELIATQGSTISVALALEVTQIQEVVVVGYGTQKKESVVGAITQVNNEALVKSGITTVTNAISGKLSGVLTIQATGEPGANQSEIIIRGLSSWNSSAPLILVDGVERDFKDLDPNEINTISVLKDASATAVFGARGANGVIIVTTKRGSVGKPQMSFSGSAGMDRATRMPDHISSYTTMMMYNDALRNQRQFIDLIPDWQLQEYKSPTTPLRALQFPNVNWFDEITNKSAPAYNANFNISGGTDFVKYFCSLGYMYQGDFYKGLNEGYVDNRFKFNRFNYRANVDFNLSKSTQLSVNLGGETGIKNQGTFGTDWRQIYNVGPARFPAYFPDWVLQQVPDLSYPDATGMRFAAPFGTGQYVANPYTTIMQGSFNNYTDSKLFTDLILDQKLDGILKGLSVRGKVSLSTYYNHQTLTSTYASPTYQLYYDRIGVDANKDGIVDQNPWFRTGETPEVYALPTRSITVGGLMTTNISGGSPGYYTDLYYEASLNYANTFGNHRVSGLALFNRQQRNSGTDFPFYNEGLVGRATYDYSRKYLLELNIGYTGSERFAPGNRFGFFPSGAIGWVISEENFFKNSVPWMNKLKLRYSDGLVGSDQASSRWLYISAYSKDASGKILEDPIANETAQWEQARKRDLGLEVAVFQNLFTFTLDFFDEYRDKMLLTPQSVPMFVSIALKDQNLGILKKHGFEVEAEFNKTTATQLNYYVKGIFGFNENRIVYKDDLPYAPDYTKAEGKPLGAQLNGIELSGDGYYTSVNDIHNNPTPLTIEKQVLGDNKYVDYNSDGQVTLLDKYPIPGSDYPPMTWSLSSGLVYKGFNFSFMFAGNIGKFVNFNQNFEVEFLKGNWSVHKSQLDYWRPDNQNVNHPTLRYTSTTVIETLGWAGGYNDPGYLGFIKDRFWRNADYTRLKEVYLGYTFKPGLLEQKIGISDLNLYLTGNNLFTITDLIEGDPERKDFQRGFYPMMASFKLGVRFSF
jgi:TonB-linked SusC/RagA family outer membrane protein